MRRPHAFFAFVTTGKVAPRRGRTNLRITCIFRALLEQRVQYGAGIEAPRQRTTSDRTVGLTAVTKLEVTPRNMKKLMSLQRKAAWRCLTTEAPHIPILLIISGRP